MNVKTLDHENHNKLKRLMAEHLELEASVNTEELEQESVESWDSSRHLSLVMEIEARFGVAFKIEEITQMRSFDDIAYYLSGKLRA